MKLDIYSIVLSAVLCWLDSEMKMNGQIHILITIIVIIRARIYMHL